MSFPLLLPLSHNVEITVQPHLWARQKVTFLTSQVFLGAHAVVCLSLQARLQFPSTCQVTLSLAIFCSRLNECLLIVPMRSSPQGHSGSDSFYPKYTLECADFYAVETSSQDQTLSSTTGGDAGLSSSASSRMSDPTSIKSHIFSSTSSQASSTSASISRQSSV